MKYKTEARDLTHFCNLFSGSFLWLDFDNYKLRAVVTEEGSSAPKTFYIDLNVFI